MQSDACAINPLSTIEHWNNDAHTKTDDLCPWLIHACSEHIGDTDLCSMLIHMYKTLAKKIYPCLDISLTYASQTDGLSVRETVPYWTRNQYLKRVWLQFETSEHASWPTIILLLMTHVLEIAIHPKTNPKSNSVQRVCKGIKSQKYNMFLDLHAHQQCFARYYQKGILVPLW